MKIGILTFHFVDNYGAVLQTLALQTTLDKLTENLNADVEVIDYRPTYHTKLRKPFKSFKMLYNSASGSNLKKIKFALLGLKTNIFYFRRVAKYKSINKFNNKFLKLTAKIKTAKNLEQISNDFNGVFVGSDQVWNKHITDNQFDDVYFSKPFPPSCLAFSYAASSGNLIEKSDTEKFKELLKRFSKISSREKALSSQISEFSGRTCLTCVDPVFLLSKDQWIKLLNLNKQSSEKRGYVLIYCVYKDSNLIKFAKQYSEKHHLNLIEVYYRNSCGGELIYNASPAKFVDLIYNAEYVVTNSFHGTAFSILMQKKFYVFEPPKRNMRIKDLLCDLNIQKELLLSETVDYNKVKIKIEEMKDLSLNYLQSCIDMLDENSNK